jgi:hypothetical protein
MEAAGNTAIAVPRGGTVKLRVSIRLFTSADFVDLYIITNLKDYMDSLGARSTAILCSLLIQIGNALGLKIPSEYNCMWARRHMWLYQSALAGTRESKEVGRLNDIANGDQLVLHCGEYLRRAFVNKYSLKGLPYKKFVKVSLISPLLHRDSNAGSTAYKVPSNKLQHVAAKCVGSITGAGGKENVNDYAAIKDLSSMPLKSAGNILHDSIRRNVAPDNIGKHNNNELIVIGSDDESDYSSEVEDVTAKWRADRDEERRKMMANADVID